MDRTWTQQIALQPAGRDVEVRMLNLRKVCKRTSRQEKVPVVDTISIKINKITKKIMSIINMYCKYSDMVFQPDGSSTHSKVHMDSGLVEIFEPWAQQQALDNLKHEYPDLTVLWTINFDLTLQPEGISTAGHSDSGLVEIFGTQDPGANSKSLTIYLEQNKESKPPNLVFHPVCRGPSPVQYKWMEKHKVKKKEKSQMEMEGRRC